MNTSLLLCLSLFSALSAMVCIALAMEKHYQQISASGSTLGILRILKITGILFLIMSLVCSMEQFGTVIGVVAWVGELTLGYIAVVLWLAWPVGFRSKT